jgi:hypothetical protein
MTQIGARNASIDSRRARRLPLFNMAECAILPVGNYRRVAERPLLANSEIRAGLLLLGATGSNGALAPLNDHFPPVCSDFRSWPEARRRAGLARGDSSYLTQSAARPSPMRRLSVCIPMRQGQYGRAAHIPFFASQVESVPSLGSSRPSLWWRGLRQHT